MVKNLAESVLQVISRDYAKKEYRSRIVRLSSSNPIYFGQLIENETNAKLFSKAPSTTAVKGFSSFSYPCDAEGYTATLKSVTVMTGCFYHEFRNSVENRLKPIA